MPLADGFGNSVRLDPAKLAGYLRSPQGPVVRRLLEDAEVVRQGARRRVGVYKPPDAYSEAHRSRRPGTLRDEIVVRAREEGGDVVAFVGVENDPVAWWHHEGTPPHIIRARSGPRLIFYWGRVGQVVAFPSVSHPGTKPNKFLLDALQDLYGRA